MRDKLKAQSTEIENLHAKLLAAAKEHEAEVSFLLPRRASLYRSDNINLRVQRTTLVNEIQSLSEQVNSLSTQVQQAQAAHTGLTDKANATANDHAEAIQALEVARHNDQTAHEAALTGLRQELETARTEHAATLETLRQEQALALEESNKAGGASSSDLEALRKDLDDQKLSHADILRKSQDELEEERAKRVETEKEHEDLLVLLEELSQKRKRDKERMKEKGMDVSEGEDEDDDEGEGEDDEDDE